MRSARVAAQSTAPDRSGFRKGYWFASYWQSGQHKSTPGPPASRPQKKPDPHSPEDVQVVERQPPAWHLRSPSVVGSQNPWS